MGLDHLTQSATAIAEDSASGVENVQPNQPPTARPSLRVIKGGLADGSDTGLEQKEAKRFNLKGVDRVGDLTVLRGEIDGQPRAIVTHTPLELLLPAEPGRPNTAFEKIRTGAFSRVAAVLALVGASAAALAGCAPDNKPKIGSSHAALSAADVDNLDEPIATAWTESGDNRPQISEMDGNVVLTFVRGGDVYYVDCAELEDCLAAGTPEVMAGLPEGFTYGTAAIYQTPEGNNKVIFRIGSSMYTMDISDIGGTLTASDDPVEVRASGPNFSLLKIDNIPHILWTGAGAGLHNLHTEEETVLPLASIPMDLCGTPHQDDGGVAIGSFLYDPGPGESYCRLHSAPTLEGLATVLADDFIASQNDAPGAGPGTNLTNPRSLGNILVYVREDADGTRIYYAIAPTTPPADGGGDADPDAGPGPDPDAGEGEAEGEDGGTDGPPPPHEDGGKTPREDAGDKPKPPDSGEGESEGEPITCNLGVGGAKVTVIEQSCTFSDCGDSDGNGNNDGDVRINGSCTVEIDLGEFGNGTPVTLTVDGEYTVNVLEQIAGQLISGLFQADTGGNDFRSAYGAYVTGPEGTTYGGEGATRMPSADPSDINMSQHPQYRVFVEEGRVTVFFNGEEIMTLNAGDEHTFPQGGPSETDDTNPKPGCQCASPGSPDNNSPLNSSLGLSLFALAAALKLRPGRSRKHK